MAEICESGALRRIIPSLRYSFYRFRVENRLDPVIVRTTASDLDATERAEVVPAVAARLDAFWNR